MAKKPNKPGKKPVITNAPNTMDAGNAGGEKPYTLPKPKKPRKP